MKQNIMLLAMTLLFAIGVTLSMTAEPSRPMPTTTEPATAVEKTQPIVTASVTPALPEVPVAMLDDVPPRPTIGSQALARWIVEPGASPATRATETTVPLPPAPATTTTAAGQPWQDSKAGIKPLEGDARPSKQPKGSSAELPGKRLKATANARACGSAPRRFADLLQRLKLAPRCAARRSAA
ncbi:MAG: hypothetical protein K2X57_27645 [Xanthobacteraceae bacterium]|nr:hypothetical protein [Xanthobacteraceae bacterium]